MVDDSISQISEQDLFSLNEKERHYIMASIQNQISELSQIKAFNSPEEAIANHKRIMELLNVIEVMHANNIWKTAIH